MDLVDVPALLLLISAKGSCSSWSRGVSCLAGAAEQGVPKRPGTAENLGLGILAGSGFKVRALDTAGAMTTKAHAMYHAHMARRYVDCAGRVLLCQSCNGMRRDV